MMKVKYKKIRGKNRRLRAIAQWIKSNERLDINALKEYQRDYVKFWVEPWSNLAVTNSVYPQPEGIFRERFLAGLAHIYCQWKAQLDNLSQPYYLKIWLFENDLKRSQVVCAIGESLNFYDNNFQKIQQDNSLLQSLDFNENEQNFLMKFTWEKMREIDVVFYDYVAEPKVYSSYEGYLRDKKWFESLEITALEKVYGNSPSSPYAYYYLIEKGKVWLGEFK